MIVLGIVQYWFCFGGCFIALAGLSCVVISFYIFGICHYRVPNFTKNSFTTLFQKWAFSFPPFSDHLQEIIVSHFVNYDDSRCLLLNGTVAVADCLEGIVCLVKEAFRCKEIKNHSIYNVGHCRTAMAYIVRGHFTVRRNSIGMDVVWQCWI